MNLFLFRSIFHDFNLSKALYFAALMPLSLIMFLGFIFYFFTWIFKCMLKFGILKFRYE
jgi:hypothetical protein